MKAVHIGSITVLIAGLLTSVAISFGGMPIAHTTTAPPQPITPLIAGDYLVAAPGRVEPASEVFRPGAAVTGILKQVLVKEGDVVKKGNVLARLEDADYVASLAKAQADVKLREAELLRVVNGARPAERQEALAAVQEAEAVEQNAKLEADRVKKLAAVSAATRSALDRAETDYTVAQEKHEQAIGRYELINDPARDEDVRIAQAQLEEARGALSEAQAALAKTVIRSPIDGTVLRIYHHPGELLSIFSNDPILSIGDISNLYVRAEIDEADIAKVAPGMPAYVTAEAYGDEHFSGKVLRVSPVLGRKNIFTQEPGERTDTKVLDVMIALNMPDPLRPGLRVNAFIAPPTMVDARTTLQSGR